VVVVREAQRPLHFARAGASADSWQTAKFDEADPRNRFILLKVFEPIDIRARTSVLLWTMRQLQERIGLATKGRNFLDCGKVRNVVLIDRKPAASFVDGDERHAAVAH
jgi:hypothetical protein